MKKKIDGIVVVEGKSDTNKIKNIFDVETIETNGSEISKETINLIKKASEKNKIYLFLDPDGPGEKIRKEIISHIDNTINIFITKNDMKKNSKKIGVAEANTSAIINAFENLISFDKNNSSISLQEYDSLNLNSRKKRSFLCNQLKISECNNKTLFKRLNMMNYDYNKIYNIMKGYNENE